MARQLLDSPSSSTALHERFLEDITAAETCGRVAQCESLADSVYRLALLVFEKTGVDLSTQSEPRVEFRTFQDISVITPVRRATPLLGVGTTAKVNDLDLGFDYARLVLVEDQRLPHRQRQSVRDTLTRRAATDVVSHVRHGIVPTGKAGPIEPRELSIEHFVGTEMATRVVRISSDDDVEGLNLSRFSAVTASALKAAGFTLVTLVDKLNNNELPIRNMPDTTSL